MNLFLNILLAAGFIALGHSACDVCKCDGTPPAFDVAYFNANIRDEFEKNETRYFVRADNLEVVNCSVSWTCNFPLLGEGQEFVFAAIGTLGRTTRENKELNCVNGSKWHSELEGDILSVGCYTSVPKSLD